MLTVSGKLVLPDNDEAPTLYDIGWGLARAGRFANATQTWYPVLPHSYTVADLVRDEIRLDALLHDAAECIISDQVSTWKNYQTKHDEEVVLKRIYNSLGLNFDDFEAAWPEIRRADLVARAAEAMVLGHKQPGLFVVESRDSDLYELAHKRTSNRIIYYTAHECLNNTHKCALEFEAMANQLIMERNGVTN